MRGPAEHRTSARAREVGELERRLVERGALGVEQVDDVLEAFGRQLGAENGARYVARAWTDPAFRDELLRDATSVVRRCGSDMAGSSNRELPFMQLVAVANAPDVHNVVVCTLCSCYPLALLGPPPTWYKSTAYRARVVREPRAVLREFELELGEDVEIRVWDSTADCRYLVLPERPAGTEGWSEDELAGLVTRNALIGTELARGPARTVDPRTGR